MSKMLKPKLINEAAYAIEVLHEQCIRLATREIFLHSYICNDTEEAGVDYRMTATFIKNLQLLDHENDDILIHMSTVGGNYPDGMAIYDSIKNAQSFITIIAYTAARSMSSIMLQAADCRVLMPHANVMLHEGSMAMEGSYCWKVRRYTSFERTSFLRSFQPACLTPLRQCLSSNHWGRGN